MIKEEMKAWIDKAPYGALLEKWRFAPVGSLWFQGEIGDYFKNAMSKKRSRISDADAVRASKDIGWGR